MTDVRHILVLPDRDAAEDVAEELVDSFGLSSEPQVLREALAGEDDAEDAQWLVVLEGPGAFGPTAGRELEALAEKYEGWLERD